MYNAPCQVHSSTVPSNDTHQTDGLQKLSSTFCTCVGPYSLARQCCVRRSNIQIRAQIHSSPSNLCSGAMFTLFVTQSSLASVIPLDVVVTPSAPTAIALRASTPYTRALYHAMLCQLHCSYAHTVPHAPTSTTPPYELPHVLTSINLLIDEHTHPCTPIIIPFLIDQQPLLLSSLQCCLSQVNTPHPPSVQ